MHCIFCKILNNEIPCSKVFENDNFIAILDALPANDAHILVIPKNHYANIFYVPEDILQEGYSIAHKIAKAFKSELDINNLNIIQNNGKFAGQIIDHFHIHIIPRYENDQVIFKSTPVEILPGRISEIISKLESKLNEDS